MFTHSGCAVMPGKQARSKVKLCPPMKANLIIVFLINNSKDDWNLHNDLIIFEPYCTKYMA